MIASGFSWLHTIPAIDHDTLLSGLGVESHTYVYVTAYLVCFFLCGLGFIGRWQLNKVQARGDVSQWFSDETLSVRNGFELVIEGIRYFMDDMLDKADVRAFLPLIGSLFLYIWVCNIISILPGFLPPTDYVNTNVGMALISLFVFLYVAFSRDPIGFLKHLYGPILILGPALFAIEVISLMVRPVALILRLTGNMFGDHLVFTIMSDLVPPVLPVAFLMLACLVSTIQAFIFALLTVIYIYLSLPHHDHDDAHAPAH